MKPNNICRRILSGGIAGKAATAIGLFVAATPTLFAQGVATSVQGQSQWSVGQTFMFLFMTLGPLNVMGPFVAITHGRDTSYRRRVALKAFVIATIALLFAATVGAMTLQKWGISVGALLITAGIILFLVALQPVLAGYKSREPRVEATTVTTSSVPSLSELALSPLAFPTIVTPYGLAMLILLITLYPLSAGGLSILGVAGSVLVLDLLVMLCADRLAKSRFFTPGLGIVGSVMGILQVALGVQAAVDGLRLLGIVGAGR